MDLKCVDAALRDEIFGAADCTNTSVTWMTDSLFVDDDFSQGSLDLAKIKIHLSSYVETSLYSHSCFEGGKQRQTLTHPKAPPSLVNFLPHHANRLSSPDKFLTPPFPFSSSSS